VDAPPIGPFGPGEPAERVGRPRRRLRAGLTQVAGLLIGLALGLTLPWIEGGPRVSATRTAEVLGVLGVSVLGFTSLMFSLLFLVAVGSRARSVTGWPCSAPTRWCGGSSPS
jgi:hypothetical protein